MIAGIPAWVLLAGLRWNSENQPGGFAGTEAVICLFLGGAIGWWMARRAPVLVSSGRWIWVAPAVVIVPDLLRKPVQSSTVPWLSEYWFGLSAFLLTLPACSIAGYSIGMAFAGIVRKFGLGNLLSPAQRVILGSVVVVGLPCLLARGFHDFELRSLASWTTVLTVIDREGVQLSADLGSLCDNRMVVENAHPILLPLGTYVESLERKGCNGNEVVEPNTLPSASNRHADYYFLDRVRVLSGPRSGWEGWVMEFRLSEQKSR